MMSKMGAVTLARANVSRSRVGLRRFCEEFLRDLGARHKENHSSMKARRMNGTTFLPLRAQCAGLERITTTANVTNLFRMLRRSLRQKGWILAAARPLTRHCKTAIRMTCSRRKCLRETQFLSPSQCGHFEGADRNPNV